MAKSIAPKAAEKISLNAASTQRAKPATPPSVPSKKLDVFANPSAHRDYVIQFQIPEFTCHCPLTGQPDFAAFTIDIVADRQIGRASCRERVCSTV